MNHRRLSQLLLVCTLLLITSHCSKDTSTTGPVAEEKSVILKMDKSAYHLNEAAELRIHNNGDQILILSSCGFRIGFDVECYRDNDWILPYGQRACLAIGGSYIINPGDTLTKYVVWHSIISKQDSLPGLYRLDLWLIDIDSGDFLDKSLRVTDAFQILPE